MTNEKRVTDILEFILETDCDPKVACEHCPELLPEIYQRLNQVRRVEQQLDELFPRLGNSSNPGEPISVKNRFGKGHLPSIKGYDVQGVLGSGGMGVVYKARHQKLNRIVALKMLRAGQFATESERARFARESQAIAELHCPHIIQIHDVGEEDGRPYFTMEFVEGGSLAEQLLGTPQPARRAAELVATLAEAIHSAHGRGIVHRDLKPANILMSKEGCAKIADFGLARHIECDQPLTVSGSQLGTPSYMAPEQALGSSDSVGPTVDVYSLGAILYELLTGRPPFRAENAVETQRQVIHVEPVAPTGINVSVPRDLETICLTCLNKDPQRRYATAKALSEDLRRFLRSEPIFARPIGKLERVARWMRRNPAPSGFVLVGLALVSLMIAFVFREFSALQVRQSELEKWKQRLGFVILLEQEGRFTEARAILGRIPDGGSSDLRRQIEQAQKELDFVERLDAIRMSRGKFLQGGGIDYEESNREYAAAFADAGIGRVIDQPAIVAERIMNSTARVAIVAALDDWAACATVETRGWLLSVVRASDPDPWRDQVRDQQLWADTEHLERLAGTADIQKHPVTLLVAMGTRWRRLGGKPTQFLQRVHQIYPDDFWLNFELAVLNTPEDAASALAHNLAALAIRPNAASVHFNLGGANERLQRFDKAIYHFLRATELEPTHSWAENRLGFVLVNSGKANDALVHFRRALELDPSLMVARNGLRITLVNLGRLDEALTVWESILNNSKATHEDVDGIAELLLYMGNEDRYQQACEIILNHFGETSDPLVRERIGRMCLLKPNSEEIKNKAIALIDQANSSQLPDEQQWAKPYLLFAKALSEYRQGHFDEAIEVLRGDASTVLRPGPDLVLAMSLHQINDREKSQEALSRAKQLLLQQLNPNTPAVTRELWLYEILRREAEGLLSRDRMESIPSTIR